VGPLVEVPAYAVGAQFMVVLDAMRRDVGQAQAEDRPDADRLVLGYRGSINALGSSTLLATDAGSRWLSDMAADFSWVTWTPSFPLARERDLWSALIGARAASRFGPAVIDRYLEALRRARHPLHAFDALLGLVAIGARHRGERGASIKGLEQALARLPERELLRPDIVALAHVEARRALVEDEGVRPGVSQPPGRRFLRRPPWPHARVRLDRRGGRMPGLETDPHAREPTCVTSHRSGEFRPSLGRGPG
jgi:hypothetical protein